AKIIPPARAVTTNTFYVDPDAAASGDGTTNALSGANCAFQSLSIWENARDNFGDLRPAPDGNDTIEVAVVDSNGAGHTADTLTARLLIDGWTTGPDNYIEIRGAKDLDSKWDDSKYRLVGGGGYSVTGIREQYVRISKLQVKNTAGTGNGQGVLVFNTIVAGGSEIWVSDSIIVGFPETDLYWGWLLSPEDADIVTFKAWNVIVQDRGPGTVSSCVGIQSLGQNLYLANVTAYGSNTAVRQGTATANAYLRNVLAAGSAAADFAMSASATYNVAYCASEDLTADDRGGYNLFTSQTFSFADAANSDFHLLSSDTGALDKGTNMTATTSVFSFSDDISGATRNGIWDIGADEWVPSSTPIYLYEDLIFGGDVILE
ncbi:MAG: hypothetical protein PHR36_03160, partial [Patescibacteria group bacterium]|nr:hypothetical protein [Patescibacteria group bacterium]